AARAPAAVHALERRRIADLAALDSAAVGVLGAVGDVLVIGRIERIAFQRILDAVEVEVLVAVERAAPVGVLVDDHRLGRAHVPVGGALHLRRVGVGIGARVARLGAVEQAVAVGVGIDHVLLPVAVVIVARVGLVAVEQAVVVAVGVVRLAAELHLELV